MKPFQLTFLTAVFTLLVHSALHAQSFKSIMSESRKHIDSLERSGYTIDRIHYGIFSLSDNEIYFAEKMTGANEYIVLVGWNNQIVETSVDMLTMQSASWNGMENAEVSDLLSGQMLRFEVENNEETQVALTAKRFEANSSNGRFYLLMCHRKIANPIYITSTKLEKIKLDSKSKSIVSNSESAYNGTFVLKNKKIAINQGGRVTREFQLIEKELNKKDPNQMTYVLESESGEKFLMTIDLAKMHIDLQMEEGKSESATTSIERYSFVVN